MASSWSISYPPPFVRGRWSTKALSVRFDVTSVPAHGRECQSGPALNNSRLRNAAPAVCRGGSSFQAIRSRSAQRSPGHRRPRCRGTSPSIPAWRARGAAGRHAGSWFDGSGYHGWSPIELRANQDAPSGDKDARSSQDAFVLDLARHAERLLSGTGRDGQHSRPGEVVRQRRF